MYFRKLKTTKKTTVYKKTGNPKQKFRTNHKQKEIRASTDVTCCKKDVNPKSKNCPPKVFSYEIKRKIICFNYILLYK